MAKQLTLILGGARSGKSRYAEELAAAGSSVLYVATAEARDDDMRQRIAAHQAQRPSSWSTLESPRAAASAIDEALQRLPRDIVLLDCITLLASNIILALGDDVTQQDADGALRAQVERLLAVYGAHEAQWVVVSNEVGLGIVPAYPLGRIYRDALGRANQQLARAADRVVLMVAGLPVAVKG